MNAKKYMSVFLIVCTAIVLTQVSVFAHRTGFDRFAWTENVAPTWNGVIGVGEWTDTERFTVADTVKSNSMYVYVKQDGTSLKIALDKPSMRNNSNQITLYFDTDHNGALNSSDLAVVIPITSLTATYWNYNGTDWVSTTAPTGTWNFYRSSDQFEFQIPMAAVGLSTTVGDTIGFMLAACDQNGTPDSETEWPDAVASPSGCRDVNNIANNESPGNWGSLAYTSLKYGSGPTAWGNFTTWNSYTYRGQPIYDWETSHDPSNGGAAVQPDDVDIASNTNNPIPGQGSSILWSFYDGGTAAGSTPNCRTDDYVAFRFWVDGDPRHSSSGAYDQRHWNVLIDIDGDGYKEFWVDLSGKYSGGGTDAIYLYYDNSNSQDLPTGTAPKYTLTADSSGSGASYAIVTPENRTAEGDGGYDYRIDIQIPYKFFDEFDDGIAGNCSFTKLNAFYSTSASLTNPLQKDWMADFCGQSETFTLDQPLCFGDEVELFPTGFVLTPLSYNEVVGPGTVLAFAHSIKNIGAAARNYTVSATACAGKTVTLYSEGTVPPTPVAANINGVVNTTGTPADSSVASGTPTASYTFNNIAAGASLYFIVEVTSAGSPGELCTTTVTVRDDLSVEKRAFDKYTVLQKESAVLINEVMYDPVRDADLTYETGEYQWVELTNTSPYYAMNVNGWEISNGTNSFPLPNVSLAPTTACNGDEARLIVVFGSPASNTGTDCLRTIYTGYTGTSPWLGTYSNLNDDLSLCTSACSSTTILDYVAYGGAQTTGDDNAVAAGIWTNGAYAASVPNGHSLSRMRDAALKDGYDTNSYTDWYDANAPSPGEENTPHIVINEVEILSTGSYIDWAELYVREDGIGGTGGVNIAGYYLTPTHNPTVATPGATALSSDPVYVNSGDYVRIWYQGGDLGTNNTDEGYSYCLTTACGNYVDLYYPTSDVPQSALGRAANELILATVTPDGAALQWIDAVVWSNTGTNANGNAWDTYALNSITVPMWNADNSPVNTGVITGNTTGRNAVSTDTNTAANWSDLADGGGINAVGETPGARNVGVILNEVMFNPINTTSAQDQWIEVFVGSASSSSSTYYLGYNGSATPLAITVNACASGGCYQQILLNDSTLNTTADALRLCTTSNCSAVVDFIAYGNASTLADQSTDAIVQAGLWTATDFISISGVRQGETIGRDMNQTDTNRSLDWDDHGGIDAVGITPAARNIGGKLIFNEVMYNPSTGSEWIEIYNPSNSAINMYGYVIQDGDGNSYTIPDNPETVASNDFYIPAGEYFVIYFDDGVSAALNDYSWDDGDPARLYVNFISGAGNDSNSLEPTDQLSLCSGVCSATSTTVHNYLDFLAWGSAPGTEDDNAVTAGIWTNSAYVDTSAVSLGESIGRDKDSTDLNQPIGVGQPSDWIDHGGADAVGITLGARNIGSVIINEVSYNTSGNPDWIELYNPTDTALNIDDYCISLDNGSTCAYRIPDIERIPSGGYAIIHFGYGVNDVAWSDGDAAVLYSAGSTGVRINEVMSYPTAGNSEWIELYCGSSASAADYRLEYSGGSQNISVTCDAGQYVRFDLSAASLGDTTGFVRLCSGTSACTSATMIDFMAYGANAGEQDNVAVSRGIWTDGAFVATTGMAQGNSIGRDLYQSDTNRTSDWEITNGRDAASATSTGAASGTASSTGQNATTPMAMVTDLGTTDSIGIYNNSTTRSSSTIVDFVAWGGSPGGSTAGQDAYNAVQAGMWTANAYVDFSMSSNETIGRSRNSTDTNTAGNATTAGDWSESGGADATAATYAAQNFTNPFFPPPPDGPTYAVIVSFRAYLDQKGVQVEWQTASEVGTIGFYLERYDETQATYGRVTSELLPALIDSPQGGTYQYLDRQAIPGKTYTYLLKEVDVTGLERENGPFTVSIPLTVDYALLSARKSSAQEQKFSRKALSLSSHDLARNQAFEKFNTSNQARRKVNQGEKVKISVVRDGLYYIESQTLADLLGTSLQQMQILLKTGKLALTNQEQHVAYLVNQDQSKVYFYGLGNTTIYAKENMYWFTFGKGQAMERVPGGRPLPAPVPLTFTEWLHIEENRFAPLAFFDDPQRDFWLWDFIFGGRVGLDRKTFTFTVPGVAPTGNATLTIHFHGGTDTPANPDRHAIVTLNTVRLGEGQWDGRQAYELVLPVPPGVLRDGTNSLEVQGVLDPGVTSSLFYVNSLDITYPRLYRAVDNSLKASPDSTMVVTVSGFTTPTIEVFDVTDPQQPKIMTETTLDQGTDSYRVSFQPETPDAAYLAIPLTQAKLPDAIVADLPTHIKQEREGADYVVITTTALKETAQRLADYRQSLGLKTFVVDVQDVYDEFNAGLASPLAIKSFLAHAYATWCIAPRYVVLVGKGTFDYRNYQGYGDNLIPLMFVATQNGLAASDTELADVIGNDGVPEMAIGRLPVVTAQELETVIEKIKRTEQDSDASWKQKILMIADNDDKEGNFPEQSDNVALFVPPAAALQKIYLPQSSSAANVRQQIIAAINGGVGLVNYVGHGATNQLAAEGILRDVDMNALNNNSLLPVMVAMTCSVGNFTYPGYSTLSEVLLLNSRGGVGAIWTSTGISYSEEAQILNEAFFRALFVKGEYVLGDIILDAMKTYVVTGTKPFMLDIYNLIGDPALRPWGGSYVRRDARPNAGTCQAEPIETRFVTIRKAGDGKGTVFAGAQECGPDCESITVPYIPKGNVLLEAVPEPGSYFAGWQNLQGKTQQDVHFAPPNDVVIAIFKKRQ